MSTMRKAGAEDSEWLVENGDSHSIVHVLAVAEYAACHVPRGIIS